MNLRKCKQILKKILRKFMKNKNVEKVNEYINGHINKKRGIVNEDKIIKKYEKKMIL